MIEQAKQKLDDELKAFKGDRYAEKLKIHVADALKSFCDNEAFAQRVLESGETLSTCVKEVVDTFKDKSYMSDFDVYARAAKFYFPECEVKFNMQLVSAAATGDAFPPSSGEIIDLFDFI